MVTTVLQTRIELENSRSRVLGDVEMSDRQMSVLTADLDKIKARREAHAHLEKIAAGDRDALALDAELQKEQSKKERQIVAERKLGDRSRERANELKELIRKAHMVDVIRQTAEQAVAFENALVAFEPLFEGIRVEIQKLDADRAALEESMRKFPDWAQNWLGSAFVQNFADRFRLAVLLEVQRIATGKKESAADFTATATLLFTNLQRAISTIEATASGDTTGRKKFRVANTNIVGISGGLNVRHDDVIFLPEDGETRKFLELGVLVPIDGSQQ